MYFCINLIYLYLCWSRIPLNPSRIFVNLPISLVSLAVFFLQLQVKQEWLYKQKSKKKKEKRKKSLSTKTVRKSNPSKRERASPKSSLANSRDTSPSSQPLYDSLLLFFLSMLIVFLRFSYVLKYLVLHTICLVFFNYKALYKSYVKTILLLEIWFFSKHNLIINEFILVLHP